jgi:hypothetical protein
LGITRAGEGWFSDGMSVLADIVFYFVPEYIFGPRLVPMLITLLVLAHMALPLFHAFSYYVIYSFYQIHVCDIFAAQGARGAGAPYSTRAAANGGGTLRAPLLSQHHHDAVVYESATMARCPFCESPLLPKSFRINYVRKL